MNEEKNKNLMGDLVKLFTKNKEDDVRIIGNGIMYRITDGEMESTNNVKASLYTEFSNNDKTVTILFSGSLLMKLNYWDDASSHFEEIQSLANKQGYYFEFGESWTMTTYSV